MANKPAYNEKYTDKSLLSKSGYRIAAIIITLVILAVLLPILELMFNNRDGEMPKFQIYSASISDFKVLNSLMTANWNIFIVSRYPTKNRYVYYKFLEVSVLYKGTLLSTKMLPPFRPGGGLKMLDVSLPQLSLEIDQGMVDSIMKEKESYHFMFIDVVIRGTLRDGKRSDSSSSFNFSCENIRVRFWSIQRAEVIFKKPVRCKLSRNK